MDLNTLGSIRVPASRFLWSSTEVPGARKYVQSSGKPAWLVGYEMRNGDLFGLCPEEVLSVIPTSAGIMVELLATKEVKDILTKDNFPFTPKNSSMTTICSRSTRQSIESSGERATSDRKELLKKRALLIGGGVLAVAVLGKILLG